MLIVKLQGGLGNQMFQYSAGRFMAVKLNTELFIDCSSFKPSIKSDGFPTRKYELDVFDLKVKIATQSQMSNFTNQKFLNSIKRKLGFSYYKIFNEINYFFDSEIFKIKAPALIKGFFQTEKYFDCIKEDLTNDFKFFRPLNRKNQVLAKEIKECNSVSIHVRRGDYVKDSTTNAFHGVCDLSYYLKAIKVLSEKTSVERFYLFSDDLPWVAENLILDERFILVDNADGDNWLDMCLMSHCKHNIIANSSYSWWGAWLNNNSRKLIVAPERWLTSNQNDTSHIVPEKWIKV